MNGDDIYTDFVSMPSQKKAVYVTGVLFFTSFIMLFFYSVRNLALSLIIHAHQESHVSEGRQGSVGGKECHGEGVCVFCVAGGRGDCH